MSKMKIQILADLHHEFFSQEPADNGEVGDWSKMKNTQADVTVLAGNTHVCQSALKIDPPPASNFDPPQGVSFGRFSSF
jgi:hypothetical protein